MNEKVEQKLREKIRTTIKDKLSEAISGADRKILFILIREIVRNLKPKIKNMDKIRVGQILIVDEGTARTPYKGLTSKEITTGNVQRRPRKRPAKKGGRAGGKGRGMGVALRGGGAVSKR